MTQKRGKILIIDDEEKLRKLLLRIISLEGYHVTEAEDLQSGRDALARESFDLVLCDVKLPDGNGIEFIPELKKEHPLTEIISLTAYGSIADGVQAMKYGAFDYLTKGDDNERIIPLVDRATEKARQAKKLERLEKKEGSRLHFDQIIGDSPALNKCIALARKVAPTSTTVLLKGETGTGKEVFAQAIHAESPRSKENFVAVNCAAFTPDLLASELFGHRKGAFTGAQKDKKGLFEEADGGTLFLDEIGEMDPELQAKLLRVLEDGQITPVGDTRPLKVDVRIIAATNRNLEGDTVRKAFRPDLYYRLSPFSIELPPLRQRGQDILHLAGHFVDQLSLKLKRRAPRLDPDAEKALLGAEWKGNVRELRNLIERALIVQEGDTLHAADLGLNAQSNHYDGMELKAVERAHLARVLEIHSGNKSETARALGIGLTTLYRKIDEYQLER